MSPRNSTVQSVLETKLLGKLSIEQEVPLEQNLEEEIFLMITELNDIVLKYFNSFITS
jgi:hypothetical protein